MNTLATIDRNRLTPFTVGFDSLLDRLFDTDIHSTGGFPPYNITKTDDYNYSIEMALAGYSKKDLEIELKEGILSISSKENEEKLDEETTLIHKGISHRHFKRSFTLSDEMKVKDAKMKDGMLVISLERIVPDHKKPQMIEVK